jgi:hypothetical protein
MNRQHAVVPIMMCLAACNATSASPSTTPVETQMTITGSQAVFRSSEAAQLRAAFGSTRSVELWLGGASADGVHWSVYGDLVGTSMAGASLEVSDRPLTLGTASVQLAGTRVGIARTGTVDFAIANGRITGSAATEPAALGGSFAGNIDIGCWVPRSALPDADPGGGTVGAAGAGEALLLDEHFSTTLCAPLRDLAK